MSSPYNIGLAQDVYARPVGAELVLVKMTTRQSFHLDAVGSAMVQAVLHTTSLEDAVEQLHEHYSAQREQLRKDLTSLLSELAEEDIVVAN